MVELIKRQREIVDKYANQFIEFLKTNEGLKGKEEKARAKFLCRL